MRIPLVIFSFVYIIANSVMAQKTLEDYTPVEKLPGQIKSIDHRIYEIEKKGEEYVRVPYLQDIYSRSYSEYDSLGKCVLRRYYHPESLHCVIQYLHNAKGLIDKEIIEFSANGKIVETTYETNKKGWITKETATYANGNDGGSISIEYDKFGNRTLYSNMRSAPDEFSFQFPDETYVKTMNRDRKGRIIEESLESGNGDLEYRRTYTYAKDSLGRNTRTIQDIESDYEDFLAERDFLTIEILNKKGEIIESYYRHKDSTFVPTYHIRTKKKYGPDGELTEEITFKKGKKIRHEYVETNGRRTEYWDKSGYHVWGMERTDSLTTTFYTIRDNNTTSHVLKDEIDVDHHGNWTEIRTFDSGELVSVEERIIVYY